MIAFILSSAIAFSFYELLAFTKWPPARTRFHFYGSTLVFTRRTAGTALHIIRVLMVVTLLLFILAIHDLASPTDVLTRYETNIVFGFVFGPLAAIWVNSVVLHNAKNALSAGQILSVLGLSLLFLLGVAGDETSRLISRYAHNLSSVKIPGAELSFASKERNDRNRLSATAPAGDRSTSGNSQALYYLANLHRLIERDQVYLTTLFAPKDTQIPVNDLEQAKSFAERSIGPPLSCVYDWVQLTGDSSSIDKYLTAYAGTFRQLEALDVEINEPASAKDAVNRRGEEAERVREIAVELVRNGVAMALDIARSTVRDKLTKGCREWFAVYCPEDKEFLSPGAPAPIKCLRDRFNEFAPSNVAGMPSEQIFGSPELSHNDPVGKRVSLLTDGLKEFLGPTSDDHGDRRGLETLPYFAISRASLMSQLDEHAAAAAILYQWLDHRNDGDVAQDRNSTTPTQREELRYIKREWLALRARAMLVTYVEDWLEEGSVVGTVAQTEHLENVKIVKDGLRTRLLKVDFFNKLDEACRTKCEPIFKRPAECDSDQARSRLQLWRNLYTSYVTMEYTYIHRALRHPDYQEKYAEIVNDEARRLVNFDLSCGIDEPAREAVYAQSLLGFAENAVSYALLRASKDDDDTQKRRLDEADRAVRFGLEIVRERAGKDNERGSKTYLERNTPSFAAQTEALLKKQSAAIQQARKDLELE